MFRNLFLVTLATLGLALSPPGAPAQSGDSFRREGQALRAEGQQLNRSRVDLSVRVDAYNRQSQALRQRAASINQMPPGVSRSAAVNAYNRDLAEHQRRGDDLRFDIKRYNDNVTSFNQRSRELNRRLNAARAGTSSGPATGCWSSGAAGGGTHAC